MKDFDYFHEDVDPLLGSELESGELDGLDAQLEDYRRRRRRYTRYVVLTTLTFGVIVWFLSGYRDEMAYAFSDVTEPRALGNVVEMTPADIPHNTYVSLEGITEHRGMTQRKMRGLSREEFWIFRLLGSGGVFIEVPADTEQYGFATQVEVAGRAVDPALSGGFDEPLAYYHERFHSERRTALRIIQVGMKPGDGRGLFIGAFVFVLGLAVSNGVVLVRLLRYRHLTAGGPKR